MAEKVIVTWGFPPRPQSLAEVRAFQAAGFTPWWFAADLAHARARYLKRDGEAAAAGAFDRQVGNIEREWDQIRPLYDGRIVTTLGPKEYQKRPAILDRLTQ